MSPQKAKDDGWIERYAKYLLESRAINARGGHQRLTYQELKALGIEQGRTLDFDDMRAELAKLEKLAGDAEKPAIDLVVKFALHKLEPYHRIERHVLAAQRHLTQAVVEMRLADNVIRNEMPDRGLSRYHSQRSAVRLAMARHPPTAKAKDVLPDAERIILLAGLEMPTQRSMRAWFNAEREAENDRQKTTDDDFHLK